MITIEEFNNIELCVAKILEAEAVEGTDKLVRLTINAGDVDEAGLSVMRQIVAGIRLAYEVESLVGKEIVVVANLEPRNLKGLESKGMLLAATGEDGLPILLTPEKEVAPGTRIK